MTRDELFAAYRSGGGTLAGEALREPGSLCWRMLCAQTRGRIREVEADSGEGRLTQQCFSDMVEAAASAGEGVLRSETLGQWTKVYEGGRRTRDQKLLAILREHLGETGLLYRGWWG